MLRPAGERDVCRLRYVFFAALFPLYRSSRRAVFDLVIDGEAGDEHRAKNQIEAGDRAKLPKVRKVH